MIPIETLLAEVRACTVCRKSLPFAPRPVFQFHPGSRILIAGQAPGIKAHESGVPFDDASGNRLRSWLGLSREAFYNPQMVSILAMGFCYPGKSASGDLPPRPECVDMWRERLLSRLEALQLTIVIGQYAQAYHLPGPRRSVTAHVQAWEEYWPQVVPLPHPSPRNNGWLAQNPWFEKELLPKLQERVLEVLAN
ncbi:MAG: uracil-DNA glycosylase family protein [Psychromonas sp.]